MSIHIIREFQGEYRWLSNFWMAKQIVNEIEFCCNEQWYVYNKCTDEGKQDTFEMNGDIFYNISDKDAVLAFSRYDGTDWQKAGAIKKFGRKKIILNPRFDQIKIEVMRVGLYAKFTQNQELRDKLLATGDAVLQEGNTWGDVFWGIDLTTGQGENWLGRLLMDLRTQLHQAA